MHVWDTFIKEQVVELGGETVNRWLRPLKVVRYDAGNIYLEAKDSFQALWFEEHIRKKADKHFVNNNNRQIKIHLTVANQIAVQKKKKIDSKRETFTLTFDDLDPHATFNSFVDFEGNKLAHTLLSSIQKQATYNPIFIYGASGTGKTHLLMAVAHALREQNLRALYARAETFTEHVVSAIRAGEMRTFRKSYRESDVLLLDDVQVFSRKRATQEELFHSFNALHLSGKQIIVTAHCSPPELQHIEPRLTSRFEWGIVLNLEKPSLEEARKILEKKAAALSFTLPPKIADFLVQTFGNQCTLLNKALEALILRAHMGSITATQLTLPIVKHHLSDLIKERQKQTLTPERLIQNVAKHFEISSEDMDAREYVLPRQIAMYLCRTQLKMPYTKIGELFSRDHSTVMTSVKQIKNSIDNDDADISHAHHSILKSLHC